MNVMKYNEFLEKNKSEGDKFIEFLRKNKYFEIPFISKIQLTSANWLNEITWCLNSAIFDTSFQKPLNISWTKIEPYLSTFHGISDQIKGIVRLTFSDNSQKMFMVTLDGLDKGKFWIPEILRLQNHAELTKESFNITDRSVQIYGATNPDSITPETTERPIKRFKRLWNAAKAKMDKLKQAGKGRNQEEESTEQSN